MKPIKVYQCKDDCCTVRVPSRRFWYASVPGREKPTTHLSFRDAIFDAQNMALSLPLEVTA